MEELDIEGIKVLFPFKPYDIQLDYMKSIIKCLKEKNNCLLESPTGTGKTLCILCPTIAWIESCEQKLINNESNDESINGSIPRVFYSSRTHSQLSQTVKQLKQTPYKSCQSVVIASRDQLCLNSEVKHEKGRTAQSLMCRQLIKEKKCHYFECYEQKVDKNINSFNDSRVDSSRVLDIEDLIDFGQRFNCCPYYGSRHLSKKVSLVFSPYNYILDPQIRRNNLNNCVLIFDEGHNIEQICEDCMSTELTSETLSVCIKHINTMEKKLKKIGDNIYTNKSFDRELVETLDSSEVNRLKTFVINLQQNIFRLIVRQPFPQTQKLFEILENSGLNCVLLDEFLGTIKQIRNISNNNKSRERGKTLSYCSALNCLYDSFEKIFPKNSMITDLETYETHKLMFCRKYKIFGSVNESTHSWTLFIWCLSPSVGVKALTDLGIYNMIITSGTLAPIHSFETEMEIKFPIRLENSHVIKNNQLLVLSISKSSDDINLISNYYNRRNTEYFRALGQTLTEVLSKVPKGVLIFFSSYGLMKTCINYWTQNYDIWDKMTDFKHLFVETNDKKTFNESIIKYKQKIDENDSKGAVFFGVCRGKLAEGIDLPDNYCRSVIMTGLPFPSVADPKVILKKQYLNEAKTDLSADDWYALQMKRALNQSIGRVVRHKDDFGIIILLDSRFATLNDGLSKWIENFVYRNYKRKSITSLQSNQTNFNQKIAKIKQFFSSYYRNFQ